MTALVEPVKPREPGVGSGRRVGFLRTAGLGRAGQPQPQLAQLPLDLRGLDHDDLEHLGVDTRDRPDRHSIEGVGHHLEARGDRLQRVQDRSRLER